MYLNSNIPPYFHDLLRKYGHLYGLIILKSRTLYLFVIFLVFLHLFLHPLPVLRRVRNAYTYKMKELDNDEKDLFFVSAYYYGNEYSLYENQVSLTFIAPRDAHWDRRKIIVIRSNGSTSVLEPMKVHRATPHNVCKFVTLVGTVTLKDDLMDLEILVSRNIAGIRYLPADNKQRDLVVCTPPIYNNVGWQSILLASHIYSRFGGHLQIYLSNTNPAFFDFLEELKRRKGISMNAFPDFYGNSKLNEVEFGGITVANSDCLSKYKSSASFITFLEWNELVLPKSFNSYFSEFANFFESEIFVGLLEFRNSKGISKVVTRPLLISSVWLNEPVERPFKLKSKQMDSNKIYEISVSDDVDSMIRGDFPGSDILKMEDRRAIGLGIRKLVELIYFIGFTSIWPY
ncbi:hypothetical protein CRE_20786 [Caenorhabditis remanei]|uniref:Glycosyltransferase family 92 protein n=1 Tax=Caenorhabditis remanei TaxID=31234 RepID=E3MFK0_CAERE|nr:hypothetical protein CRE_20786 [Caenorhabditis remanei]